MVVWTSILCRKATSPAPGVCDVVTFVALICLWHGLLAAFTLAEIMDPAMRATHLWPKALGHLAFMSAAIVLLAS